MAGGIYTSIKVNWNILRKSKMMMIFLNY